MPETTFHVAVVDDDLPVRTALSRLLSASSFAPTAYESAHDLIVSLAVEVPDCLIADIHMPDMSGIELQYYLAYAGFKVPTIVITAQDDLELRAECKRAGAVAFLVKPFAEAELIAALNIAADSRHATKGTSRPKI